MAIPGLSWGNVPSCAAAVLNCRICLMSDQQPTGNRSQCKSGNTGLRLRLSCPLGGASPGLFVAQYLPCLQRQLFGGVIFVDVGSRTGTQAACRVLLFWLHANDDHREQWIDASYIPEHIETVAARHVDVEQ